MRSFVHIRSCNKINDGYQMQCLNTIGLNLYVSETCLSLLACRSHMYIDFELASFARYSPPTSVCHLFN